MNRFTNLEASLSSYYHPVARIADLSSGDPIRVELLGQPYVVCRLADEVVAFQDSCPHRRARLSLGRVVGSCLQCPYHGLIFDAHGRCATSGLHPKNDLALRRPARVSERYGLIWIAPCEPHHDIPDMPSGVRPDNLRLTILEPFKWNATAAQIMENFLDVSHFRYVHHNSFSSLGGESLIEPPRPTADGFSYRFSHRGRRIIGEDNAGIYVRTLSYRYFAPFTMTLSLAYDDRYEGDLIFISLLPQTAEATQIYKLVLSSTTEVSASDAAREYKLQRQVTEEDRLIVESLPKEGIELDLIHAFELDAPTVAFRQELRRMKQAAG